MPNSAESIDTAKITGLGLAAVPGMAVLKDIKRAENTANTLATPSRQADEGKGTPCLYEIAVQAATTPENLVFGVGSIVVIGGTVYWVSGQ